MHKIFILIVVFLSACATKHPPKNEQAKPNAEEYYQRALSAYHQNELTKALQTAELSVATYPGHAYSHQLIGLINQRQGNKTIAAESLGQALTLAPKDAGITNNYASLLCSLKRYAKAEKYYLAAAGYPNNKQPDIAWTNAGLCAQRANQPTNAQSFYEQAIKINPGQATALYQLAKLELKNNNTLIANNYLNQYLEHATHTAKTLLLGAQIENAQGNPSGVEGYVDMLRAAFPDSTEKTTAEQLTPIAKNNVASNTLNIPSAQDEEWIRNRTPSHYTILIASDKNKSNITDVAGNTFPYKKAIYSVNLGGNQLVNLITGDFQDFNAAQVALTQIKPTIPTFKPWIRTFESIQAILNPAQDSFSLGNGK
ncbi:MAG: hypothetical protein DSZ28_03675 [Thiothrix sp.]|nr:MAG: hypothetical protein DSZ28_03675 [Thiothrix sp.]